MEFRRDIEGLRGIAVMLVVLSHLEIFGITGGFIGVDVFFVISGFLITSIICHEYLSNQSSAAGKGTFSLAAFYSRRVRRIVPLSLVVLFCTTLTSYQIFNSVRGDRIQTDSIWAAFFVANIRFIRLATDYFQQGFAVSPVQHFWSLAVEEQFYIFFPGLFLLSTKWHGLKVFGFRLKWNHRVGLLIGAITVSSFMWSLAQTSANPTSSYFSSLTRAWEIGVGGLVAVAALGLKDRLSASMRTTLATIGLLFVIYAAFRFDAATPFPGVAALLPVGGAALIIIAGIGGTHVIADVLSFKVLTFIGRISFSVYLWHWPIIVIMKSTHPTFAEGFFGKVSMLIFTIILSFFSFKFVEQPFRKMQFLSGRLQDKPARKRRSTFRGFVPLAIPVAFLLLIFGLYVGMNRYYESKNEANVLVELATDATDTESTPDSVPLLGTDYEKLLAEWQTKIVEGTRLEKIPSEMSPKLSELLNVGYGISCPLNGSTPLSSQCSFGNSAASRTAIIFGDSFAMAIYPMVTQAMDLNLWKITALTKPQCPIANVVPWVKGSPFSECVEHRERVFRFIEEVQPDLLILADSGGHVLSKDGKPLSDSRKIWKDGVYASLDILTKIAKKIVYFGSPPTGVNLIDCVNSSNELSRSCWNAPESRSDQRDVQRQATESSGNLFIDPVDWLCRKFCPPVIDNTPVFWDGSHIAPEFAKKLAPLFRAFLVSNNILDSGAPTNVATPTQPSIADTESDYAELLGAWQKIIVEGTRLEKIPSAMSPKLSELPDVGYGFNCPLNGSTPLPSQCSFGNSSASRTAIIFGDSFAMAIYPMVTQAMDLEEWHVIPLTMGACMVANVVPWVDGSPYSECAEHRERVFRFIAEAQPDLLILADNPTPSIYKDGRVITDTSQVLEFGLAESLDKLTKAAKRTVYFGRQPTGVSLIDCVDSKDSLSSSCLYDQQWSQYLRDIQRQAIESSGNLFIDPVDWLCSKICPPIIDNTPVFWDGAHIAPEFAKKLAPLFRAFLVSNNLL